MPRPSSGFSPTSASRHAGLRSPPRRAIPPRSGTGPNHPGLVVRCSTATQPPAREDAPEPLPDRDISDWDLFD